MNDKIEKLDQIVMLYDLLLSALRKHKELALFEIEYDWEGGTKHND